jgi:CMP/dCMP kinase
LQSSYHEKSHKNYQIIYFKYNDDFYRQILSGKVLNKKQMKKIIVTIDGWSSCGKSTLAKQLAEKLNYVFIDSGAMYRAITLFFIREHIDWTDADKVMDALKNISLEFIFNPTSQKSEIYLNGENVEYVIRDMVVAEKVSEVAAIKEVREFAVAQQQKMGSIKGIVMDGRDIGTVVFPDAELKIFMTADNAIRVERRFREMIQKNPNISIEEVKSNLEMRDYIDSNREFSPLRKAADARILDNTNISEKEQFDIAYNWVMEKVEN